MTKLLEMAARVGAIELWFDAGAVKAADGKVDAVMINEDQLRALMNTVALNEMGVMIDGPEPGEPVDNVPLHYEYPRLDENDPSDTGLWPVLIPDGFKVVRESEFEELVTALRNLTSPSTSTTTGGGESYIGWQKGYGLTARERVNIAKKVLTRYPADV
jgi:hypothetical protein